MLTLRPIYIVLVCYFGTGQIIPFSGWGIPVWISIFVICLLIIIVYLKNKTNVEKWLMRFKPQKIFKKNKN